MNFLTYQSLSQSLVWLRLKVWLFVWLTSQRSAAQCCTRPTDIYHYSRWTSHSHKYTRCSPFKPSSHVITEMNHAFTACWSADTRCSFKFRFLNSRVFSPDPALCASLVHECCSPVPRKIPEHLHCQSYRWDQLDQGSHEARGDLPCHF